MPLWSSKEEESQIILEEAGDLGSKVILDSTDGTADDGFYILQEEQNEVKPQYLDRTNPMGKLDDCFANNQGWWLRHSKSTTDPSRYWDELLVAIGDLAGGSSATSGLGEATIDSIRFSGLTSGTSESSPVYEVGSGPQFLADLNGEIYIARTFYDADWNPAYGTSKISSSGVEQIDHVFAAGSACGGSVLSLNNKVYRSFDGGIAQIGNNLEIDVLNRIGSFNQNNVYHIEVIDGNILFALADYADLNQVHVLNQYGDTISEYDVGPTPGDFTFWKKSEE